MTRQLPPRAFQGATVVLPLKIVSGSSGVRQDWRWEQAALRVDSTGPRDF